MKTAIQSVVGGVVLLVASIAVADRAAPPPEAKPAAPAVAPVPPPSGDACFELSPNGKTWSRTPERLCIGSGDKNVAIRLTTGMPTATEVAVFHLDRKERARCLDCNKDVYALLNPENSVFNALAITFNGKRDVKAGTESGTLTIGKTKFFYRKAP